jgi:hypothetical protein
VPNIKMAALTSSKRLACEVSPNFFERFRRKTDEPPPAAAGHRSVPVRPCRSAQSCWLSGWQSRQKAGQKGGSHVVRGQPAPILADSLQQL